METSSLYSKLYENVISIFQILRQMYNLFPNLWKTSQHRNIAKRQLCIQYTVLGKIDIALSGKFLQQYSSPCSFTVLYSFWGLRTHGLLVLCPKVGSIFIRSNCYKNPCIGPSRHSLHCRSAIPHSVLAWTVYLLNPYNIH